MRKVLLEDGHKKIVIPASVVYPRERFEIGTKMSKIEYKKRNL